MDNLGLTREESESGVIAVIRSRSSAENVMNCRNNSRVFLLTAGLAGSVSGNMWSLDVKAVWSPPSLPREAPSGVPAWGEYGALALLLSDSMARNLFTTCGKSHCTCALWMSLFLVRGVAAAHAVALGRSTACTSPLNVVPGLSVVILQACAGVLCR